MSDSGRPRIGEILMRAGLIDQSQIRLALSEQARVGGRLGATLVKLGFVEEKDLVRALAAQFQLPVASIAGKRIRAEVLALVPAEVAYFHRLIPLFTTREAGQDCLYLGVEEPADLERIDESVFGTAMHVRPVLVVPSELDQALARWYGPDRAGAVEREPEFQKESAKQAAVGAPAGLDAKSRSKPELGTECVPESVDYWTLDDPPQPADREQAGPGCAETMEPMAALGGLSGDARTRHLVRALTHLLIDKGLITRSEWVQQVQRMPDGRDPAG